MAQIKLKSVKKILIINIFGIGDVLFTTPLIRRLKEANPGVFIGYLANRRTAPIVQNLPQIDKVFIYDRDEFEEVYRQSRIRYIQRGMAFFSELRKEHFELVLDLSLNSSMNFLTWLIGIPQRIGFNYKNRSPFLTQKIDLLSYEGRHVVDFYLSLLEILGIEPAVIKGLEFPINPSDRQFAQEWFKKNGFMPQDIVVGLVPGGGASWGKEASLKRWTAEKYAKLADKMIEKFSVKIILMGDENERDLCAHLNRQMQHRSYVACGETSVGQCAALLARCTLAVVNDGGPLHLAVASGVKTVSIFGPVDEQVYGPYPRHNHIVVTKGLSCQPCYRNFRMSNCRHLSCLNSLEVDEVLRKVEEIL